jgi:hypothetical protein
MKEKFKFEDGREAERHVIEEVGDDGSVKKVIETFVEPKIEKKLSKRVVEHSRPTVFKREIESVNEATGEVEVRIESVEPNVRMELREHIVDTPVRGNENLVTKDDIKDLIQSLKTVQTVSAFSVPEPAVVPAQEIVKERVAKSNKYLKPSNLIIGTLILGQVGWLAYTFFFAG